MSSLLRLSHNMCLPTLRIQTAHLRSKVEKCLRNMSCMSGLIRLSGHIKASS